MAPSLLRVRFSGSFPRSSADLCESGVAGSVAAATISIESSGCEVVGERVDIHFDEQETLSIWNPGAFEVSSAPSGFAMLIESDGNGSITVDHPYLGLELWPEKNRTVGMRFTVKDFREDLSVYEKLN